MLRFSVRAARTYTGWAPFGCVAAAVALLAVSAVLWVSSPTWGARTVIAVPRDVGTVPGRSLAGTVPVRPSGVAPAAPAPAGITPTRIDIARIGTAAPVRRMSMEHRVLDPPVPPTTVGWWTGGPKPGAPIGTAVIAGHINYGGVPGALGQIGRLDPGDRVIVHGTRRSTPATVTFRVTGVRTYLKRALPWAQIFDQQVSGRLVLITCGGPFDAKSGNYRDNIVVYAVPVR